MCVSCHKEFLPISSLLASSKKKSLLGARSALGACFDPRVGPIPAPGTAPCPLSPGGSQKWSGQKNKTVIRLNNQKIFI